MDLLRVEQLRRPAFLQLHHHKNVIDEGGFLLCGPHPDGPVGTNGGNVADVGGGCSTRDRQGGGCAQCALWAGCRGGVPSKGDALWSMVEIETVPE